LLPIYLNKLSCGGSDSENKTNSPISANNDEVIGDLIATAFGRKKV
jgi:hypothetical protein